MVDGGVEGGRGFLEIASLAALIYLQNSGVCKFYCQKIQTYLIIMFLLCLIKYLSRVSFNCLQKKGLSLDLAGLQGI